MNVQDRLSCELACKRIREWFMFLGSTSRRRHISAATRVSFLESSDLVFFL